MQGTLLGKCWVSVSALAEMAAVEVAARELSSGKFCCRLSGISAVCREAGVFQRAITVAITYNLILTK